MILRRSSILLGVSALLVAGCGGGGGSSAGGAQTASTQAAITTQPARPGDVLTRFVEAAGAGDAKAMWALLSKPTQRRMGPTLAKFQAGPAGELAEGVGAFAKGDYKLILRSQIGSDTAVAAIAGIRVAEGKREYSAYGAALRLEGGKWRLELGGPITVSPIAPRPGEIRQIPPVQLAVELRAKAPILEAGVWLDGQAFPTRGSPLGAKSATAFGEPPAPLGPGRHSVVAFASTARDASAFGWAFTVRS